MALILSVSFVLNHVVVSRKDCYPRINRELILKYHLTNRTSPAGLQKVREGPLHLLSHSCRRLFSANGDTVSKEANFGGLTVTRFRLLFAIFKVPLWLVSNFCNMMKSRIRHCVRVKVDSVPALIS